MKRLCVLLLACATVLALFAGCTGGTTETQTPATEAPAATEVPAAETAAPETETPTEEPDAAYFPLAETRVLSYWMSYPPIFGDYAEGPNEYLVYTEAEARLNVELEWTFANFMAATEQFNIMISSGDYTDMIAGYETYSPSSIEQSVEDGIVLDLTELIAQYAPDYAALRLQNDITAKTSSTDDGRLLQFYSIQSEEGLTNDKGLFVRQDWLDESGVGELVTLNDYEEFLTYTSRTYGAGLALPCQGTWNSSCFEGAFDIILPFGNTDKGLFHIDGEVKFGAVEEGFREYLTLMHEWYEAGLIMDDFESDTASQTSGYPDESNIASGKTSVFFGVANDFSLYEDLCEADLTAVAYPLVSEDQTRHTAASLGNASSVAGICITTGCEDPELAVRFVNWFYTEEGQILTNYGVEGFTFNYEGDEIVFTDVLLNNPDGMSLNVAMTLYTGGTSGVPMYIDNTKYEKIYDDEQYQARVIWTQNDDSAYSLASVVLNSEESEQVNSVWSDIQTYFFENCLQFIIGTRSLDEFDDFVQTIYNQGLQEVLDAYTSAYERFANR